MQTLMKPQDDILTMKRAEYTAKFIAKYLNGNAKSVLDIGENNPVGNYLADLFELNLQNTIGDLDYNFSATKIKYDVVFCLEVLEHLLSPKFFLIELKKYIHPQSQIFITYPSRPKFLWTDQHFHEYDIKRFTYLIKLSGYKIIDIKKKRFPRNNYLKGIRTPFRIFFDRDLLIYLKQG